MARTNHIAERREEQRFTVGETVTELRKYANGTFKSYMTSVRSPQGKIVAWYCDPVEFRSRDMAAAAARDRTDFLHGKIEEDYPCGLFKGPEDY